MRRTRQNQQRSNRSNVQQQALVSVPRGPRMPSSAKRIERTVARYSGANFTLATSSGYSYFPITSARFSESSPWTQLSALYMFIRPVGVKVSITGARSTGTSDNPVVAFVPTPDGQPVGSASMNLNTFEAATGRTMTLPPGVPVSYFYDAYVAVAAYSTPTNGYIPIKAPRMNLNSLPTVYFGDILLSTPGVNVTTTANYVQVKLEWVFEFDTLDASNIQ